MEAIIDGKDLNIAQLNRSMCAAATVITEQMSETRQYKLVTRRSRTPPWVRRKQESINGIRKELSALVEIKRYNRRHRT